MEAEKEQDPFFSLIKLCQPTASQEAKFRKCPFAGEPNNFSDSNLDYSSSSPDPTPSEPTRIIMVSLPGSDTSVQQQVEDDAAVFHTPPEHHLPSYFSSSEDQHLDELAADGVRNVDVGIGETEAIAIEIEGNEVVREAEIIVLDSADSGDEMATTNLAEDSTDIISKDRIESRTIDVVRKIHDAIDGNQRLGKKLESMEDIQADKGKKRPLENSDKSKEEIVKLKCTVVNECSEMRRESGVGGSEKVVKVTKHEKIPKDGNGDGKRIEEIDEFRYVSVGDRAVGGSGKRRQLPASLKGDYQDVGGEKVVETVESKSGLLDLLDVLKVVVGDTNGDREDVDFIRTAKMRGLTFPRPRWWPAEW
ncbi:hypothetical protein DH2020_048800 [Rehmannia glutinosa]|uniref:Uncharacterized protein n=1 Tax=Rehmannia glutinosa TaxID=99300 RepID=A0ABR0U4N2_REHGL